LTAAVNALPFWSGTTATGEALTLAKNSLKDRRPNLPLYVIVITDGYSQDEVAAPADALRKEPKITVLAVGVTKPLNEDELVKIAGDEAHTFIGDTADAVKGKVLAVIPKCGGVGRRVVQVLSTVRKNKKGAA